MNVAVTGLGATTPLGGDVPSTWSALLAGESGVSPLREDWAKTLPVRIAARLRVEPTEVLDRVQARRLDRCRVGAALVNSFGFGGHNACLVFLAGAGGGQR